MGKKAKTADVRTFRAGYTFALIASGIYCTLLKLLEDFFLALCKPLKRECVIRFSTSFVHDSNPSRSLTNRPKFQIISVMIDVFTPKRFLMIVLLKETRDSPRFCKKPETIIDFDFGFTVCSVSLRCDSHRGDCLGSVHPTAESILFQIDQESRTQLLKKHRSMHHSAETIFAGGCTPQCFLKILLSRRNRKRIP